MSHGKPISSCQVSSTTPSVHKLQQQLRKQQKEEQEKAALKSFKSPSSASTSSFKSPSTASSSSFKSPSTSSSSFKSPSSSSSSFKSPSSSSSSFKSPYSCNSTSSFSDSKSTYPPPRRVTYVTDYPTRYEKPLPNHVIEQAVRDLERRLICKPGKAKR